MASPAKITDVLPETLPGDFGEWDGQESPLTPPVRPAGSESGPSRGVVPKPPAQPAESRGAVTALGNVPRAAVLPASAPESAEDAVVLHLVRSLSPALDRLQETVVQRSAAAPAMDEVRFSAPWPNGVAAAAAWKAPPAPQAVAVIGADEILFRSVRAGTAEPAKKKRPIIAGTSAALAVVLAAATITLLSHREAPSVKPDATQEPAEPASQQPEDAALRTSPSARRVPALAQPALAGNAKHPSDAAPVPDQNTNAGPSQTQTLMMSDQLDAPARIHTAAPPAEQAPPPSGSFAGTDMNGSDNNSAIGSIFSNANQPRVQASVPNIVNVSANVAMGMLIRKTPPVYPRMARDLRIAGTVVLHVHISKNGTVEDVRVVSGPELLRQPAADAVRTWRYSPYKINNEPSEIETTISVIFSLQY
jgi:periplasmic protein TonB